MNIAYIYIEKYKHLENIGFNFLPNHKFEYKDGKLTHNYDCSILNIFAGKPMELDESEPDNPMLFGKVLREKEKKAENDLFNNINITGIIGENGTGKSTILEFIANYINGNFSNLGNFLMVTTKDKFELICSKPMETKFMIHDKKDDFSYYKEVSMSSEDINIQQLSLFSSKEGWENETSNEMAKTIYYSNILDFTGVTIGTSKKFINTSSSYILNNYHKNYDKVQRAKKALDFLDPKLITGEREKLEDTDRQHLRIIKEYFEGNHDFEAQIIAGYQRDTYNEIVKFFISTLHGTNVFPYYSTNEKIRNFLNDMNMPKTIEINFTSFSSDMKYIKEYKKEFIDHLWNLCTWNSEKDYEVKKNIILLKFIASSIAISDDKELISSFIKNIEDIQEIEAFSIEDLKAKISNREKDFLKAIEKMEFLLAHERVRISDDNQGILVIDINDRTKEVNKIRETLFFLMDNIKEMIKKSEFLIKKINHSILNFDFDRKLSSGELGMLILFSRFYKNYPFSYVERNDSLVDVESFIVLLDEPEMYLHMEWQRSFVQLFLNFIGILFERMKFVQIVFTSHSPFLISDIPRENVIFLKKDGEAKKTIVYKPSGLENTFAANIHTLVKNGFFMTSTIGEFAKTKIEEVIKIINAGEYNKSKENKEFCDYIISIIGEPLIKNKLLSMIESNEKLSDKIKRVEKELEELRKLQENETCKKLEKDRF